MTYTHTYVIMNVSESAYTEIKKKLEDADYHHAIHDNRDEDGVVLDMHGIALAGETARETVAETEKVENRTELTRSNLTPSDPPILVDWDAWDIKK